MQNIAINAKKICGYKKIFINSYTNFNNFLRWHRDQNNSKYKYRQQKCCLIILLQDWRLYSWGVLAGIEVNGEEIARLGTNEYTQYTVNGNYSVHVFGAGINGFGMGSGRITGQGKKGAKHYYLIGVDAGLFTTSFTINEVTETTFKQLR